MFESFVYRVSYPFPEQGSGDVMVCNVTGVKVCVCNVTGVKVCLWGWEWDCPLGNDRD